MNAKKLYVLFVFLLISVSGFSFLFGRNFKVVNANPDFLEVSISPTNVKLGVGQVQVFTATVVDRDASYLPYSYSWSSNGTILGTSQSLSFSFSEACNGTVLSVTVVSARGNQGYASTWVSDPYTSPNVYLNSFAMPYSYLIQTDGLGWYRAINGVTGAIVYSSTNASYVWQSVSNALPATATVSGGKIYAQGYQILSNQVNFKSGVHIYGASDMATNIRADTPFTGTALFVFGDGIVNTLNIEVDHLTFWNGPTAIKFNRVVQGGHLHDLWCYSQTINGIYLSNGTGNAHINDCWITGAPTGIRVGEWVSSYLDACTWNSIDYCSIDSATENAIRLGSGMGNRISYCYLATAGSGNGVFAGNVTGMGPGGISEIATTSLSHNRIVGHYLATGYGIKAIKGGAEDCMTIESNDISAWAIGIYCEGSSNQITQNYFEANTQYAIFINGSSTLIGGLQQTVNNHVEINRIITTSSNSSHGIRIATTNCTYVIGAYFTRLNPLSYDIIIDNTANNTLISNTFPLPSELNINDSGAHTVLYDPF